MKRLTVGLFVFFGLISSLAFAEDSSRKIAQANAQICGVLTSVVVGPNCAAGQACPQFMRLQYQVIKDDESKVDVSTAKTGVFHQFEKYKGDQVCATGQESGGSFTVTAIKLKH